MKKTFPLGCSVVLLVLLVTVLTWGFTEAEDRGGIPSVVGCIVFRIGCSTSTADLGGDQPTGPVAADPLPELSEPETEECTDDGERVHSVIVLEHLPRAAVEETKASLESAGFRGFVVEGPHDLDMHLHRPGLTLCEAQSLAGQVTAVGMSEEAQASANAFGAFSKLTENVGKWRDDLSPSDGADSPSP